MGLFRKREVMGAGSVLFRGTLPPRAEEFEYLRAVGIEVQRASPSDAHWGLDLRHPEWGEATLVCLREAPPPPPSLLVDYSVGMTRKEKEQVKAGRSLVGVTNNGRKGDVLWDRKCLLWYLRQVMGEDGVGAMDHGSQRFWTQASLDDELCHDATLDVESLFVIHAVTEDDVPPGTPAGGAGEADDDRPPPRAHWVHTHGLAELGAFDVDLIEPSGDVGGDVMRSLAFAILEGHLAPDAASFHLARPGGHIRLVPAERFMRSADAQWASKRDHNEEHRRNRSVVCDPVGPIAKMLRAKPRPSRFMQREDFDGCTCAFSDTASDLMAERARLTFPLLRRLHEEFEKYNFPFLVKLACATSRGGREHMWFEVHGFGDADVDATLLNRPFDVPGMSEGDRGRHSLENLSDWTISTPMAPITPRDTLVARALREDPAMAEEILALIQTMQSLGM